MTSGLQRDHRVNVCVMKGCTHHVRCKKGVSPSTPITRPLVAFLAFQPGDHVVLPQCHRRILVRYHGIQVLTRTAWGNHIYLQLNVPATDITCREHLETLAS